MLKFFGISKKEKISKKKVYDVCLKIKNEK